MSYHGILSRASCCTCPAAAVPLHAAWRCGACRQLQSPAPRGTVTSADLHRRFSIAAVSQAAEDSENSAKLVSAAAHGVDDAWLDARADSSAPGAQEGIARDCCANKVEAPAACAADALDDAAPAGTNFDMQVAVAAQLPFQPLGGSTAGNPLTSISGFVWALALLFAIRLSRMTTERAAFTRRSEEVSEEALINDQQLFAARREYEQQEAAARAVEASERLLKAKEEARAREAERVKRERQRAAEAAEVKRRAEEAAAARRKAFEEAEAASAALLAEKTEAERKAREERERILAEERAAARRAEEERQRQLEAEQRAAEAEEAQKAAEARAAKEAERKALARLAKRFAVRLEGAVSIAKPPLGAKTAGRPPQEALVQLGVSLGSAVGEAPREQAQLFASLSDAREGAVPLAGAAARAAATSYASSMRLQAMMGQGPLEAMDEPELQHWMHVAAARSAAVAAQALLSLLDGATERVAPAQRPLQVRTERGVLPADHPKRVSSRLDRAIASVEAGRLEEASAVLASTAEDEQRSFLEGLDAPAPRHLGCALSLAHFLDRMLAQRPARTTDAPAWFEAAAGLVRSMLGELTRGAAQDSLTPLAAYVEASLGVEHPVARMVRELAEANMSKAAKAVRLARQCAAEAALAAALVEEEWPDASELAAQRAAAREAETPIPERVWALRNVAATAAMGGPSGAARAVQLLEKALELKEGWVGGPEHPGLLPELDALAGVLASLGGEWKQREVTVRERALRILSRVAARYRTSGHPASAVALLEAAVREHEQGLGLRHRGVTALMRRAEEWFEELPSSDLRLKAADRRRDPGVVKRVVEAFAEDLVSATGAGVQRFSKAQLWDQGGLGQLPIIVGEPQE